MTTFQHLLSEGKCLVFQIYNTEEDKGAPSCILSSNNYYFYHICLFPCTMKLETPSNKFRHAYTIQGHLKQTLPSAEYEPMNTLEILGHSAADNFQFNSRVNKDCQIIKNGSWMLKCRQHQKDNPFSIEAESSKHFVIVLKTYFSVFSWMDVLVWTRKLLSMHPFFFSQSVVVKPAAPLSLDWSDMPHVHDPYSLLFQAKMSKTTMQSKALLTIEVACQSYQPIIGYGANIMSLNIAIRILQDIQTNSMSLFCSERPNFYQTHTTATFQADESAVAVFVIFVENSVQERNNFSQKLSETKTKNLSYNFFFDPKGVSWKMASLICKTMHSSLPHLSSRDDFDDLFSWLRFESPQPIVATFVGLIFHKVSGHFWTFLPAFAFHYANNSIGS